MKGSSGAYYVNSNSLSESYLNSIQYMRNRGSKTENAHTLVGLIGQAFQGGATEQQVLLSLRCLKIREGINHPLGTMQGLIDRRPEVMKGWPDGFADRMKAHFNSDGDRAHVQRPTAQGFFLEAVAPRINPSLYKGLTGRATAMYAEFRLAAMSGFSDEGRRQLLGFDPSAYNAE